MKQRIPSNLEPDALSKLFQFHMRDGRSSKREGFAGLYESHATKSS
jgi:hypothetical protein